MIRVILILILTTACYADSTTPDKLTQATNIIYNVIKDSGVQIVNLDCSPERFGNVAWVYGGQMPRNIHICNQWIELFTVGELVVTLLHEYSHTQSTFLQDRYTEETSADAFAYKTAHELGLSKDVCLGDLKLAKILNIPLFLDIEGAYPSQYKRFKTCESYWN